ncbi:MAG: hypothetical protein AB1444_03110 [Spirochaetota bacterium]
MMAQHITAIEQSIEQLNNLLKGLAAVRTGLSEKLVKANVVANVSVEGLGTIIDSYQ